MPTNRLRDLTITEVSLVDKPAAPEARVLLFKRAPDDPLAHGKSLIEKCLDTIQHENWSSISKAEIEESLDHLAQARARVKGESYFVAYAEVLKTDDGARLYGGLEALRVEKMMAARRSDDAA